VAKFGHKRCARGLSRLNSEHTFGRHGFIPEVDHGLPFVLRLLKKTLRFSGENNCSLVYLEMLSNLFLFKIGNSSVARIHFFLITSNKSDRRIFQYKYTLLKSECRFLELPLFIQQN
jgi:hypothetical protein